MSAFAVTRMIGMNGKLASDFNSRHAAMPSIFGIMTSCFIVLYCNRLVLLSQKVAGDCNWESVIEGDSHFSI